MSYQELGDITKPAILRLAHRVGVVRVSGLMFEETRGILGSFLGEFLRRVVIHTEHDRKHTVSVNHVYASMWPNKVLLTTKDLKDCQSKSKDIQTCLSIPKAPFERLVRAIFHQYKKDLRIQGEAALLIQYYTEMYLLKLWSLAHRMAMHGQRMTVEPRDLQSARYALKMAM
jgi:histone H3/H4